jgi:hypothetical protein
MKCLAYASPKISLTSSKSNASRWLSGIGVTSDVLDVEFRFFLTERGRLGWRDEEIRMTNY